MPTVAVSGIVLAGGESRRMRSDKRAALVGGEPLLRRVLRAVAAVSDELIVVESSRSPVPGELLDGFTVRVVADRVPDGGPLAGIEAGLRAARMPVAIVVAADAAWLEPPLLRMLVARLTDDPAADATVVVSDRGPEPLLAAYRPSVAAEANRLLEAGERRMGALLEALTLRSLDASVWRAVDPDGGSLRNANVPDDLRHE